MAYLDAFRPTNDHSALLEHWRRKAIARAELVRGQATSFQRRAHSFIPRVLPGEDMARIVEMSCRARSIDDLKEIIDYGIDYAFGATIPGLHTILIEGLGIEPHRAACDKALATWSITARELARRWQSPEDDRMVCNGQIHMIRDRHFPDGAYFGPCPAHQGAKAQSHAALQQRPEHGTWATAKRDRNNGAAYDALRVFLTGPKQHILLTGPSGTGKTWLAEAVFEEAKTMGLSLRWWKSTDFAERARTAALSFGEEAADARGYLAGLLTADLVVLDDLGAEPQLRPDVVASALQEFLDGYKGKLLVTSNLDGLGLGKLPSVGERCASRLIENGDEIALGGPDRRKSR